MFCPKGCEREVGRFVNGLLTFNRLGALGLSETTVSTQVRGPSGMADEYAAMVRLTPLANCAPTLEFYNDLHDVGGIFTAPDWAILVGMGDMKRIASNVLATWYRNAERIFIARNGVRPTRAGLFEFVTHAAAVRCIGHELGHALISSGSSNPYAPDAEAGADYYAGRLDAARGRSRAIGEMFFWSIGCVGPSCSHPRPDIRATAYGIGYDEQLAAA